MAESYEDEDTDAMAWYDGVEQIRLLVFSSDPATGDATGDDMGSFVQIPHPKTGVLTSYLLINGGLQELNWFRPSYGSWFMEDYSCTDGGLYAATPVDPVFLLLPYFYKARKENGNDVENFKPLDKIITFGDNTLSSIAEKTMEVVCDIDASLSQKTFRLNDKMVVNWMRCKVKQVKAALLKLDENDADQIQKDDLEVTADAVKFLGEYLQDDPWLKLLHDKQT